jgi:hypothetical protein
MKTLLKGREKKTIERRKEVTPEFGRYQRRNFIPQNSGCYSCCLHRPSGVLGAGECCDLATVFEKEKTGGQEERLRMQHTKAIRDKSKAENKSQNILEKAGLLEKENKDLGCRLNEEKDAAD